MRRSEKGFWQGARSSSSRREKGSTHLISDHLPKIASILDLPEEELVLGYDLSRYTEILHEKDRRIAELEAIIADKNKIIELQAELLKKI